MKEFAGKVWPLLFVVCLFVGCSLFIQANKDFFLAVLAGFPPRYVIAIYFCITLATVLIPFTSILPFLPLAVLALGWQMTALITGVAWLVGAQILFELSRSFAQPYLLKLIPQEHVRSIAAMLNKKGLPQALFVRMMVHDDFVSIAFGLLIDLCVNCVD
ncbi:MAG TPA: hypothetical protein PKV72_04260, partial [Candidatus Peribacteria bacterium]|nr:hypothetical protein [Candidatus Peribacteria bacterium]